MRKKQTKEKPKEPRKAQKRCLKGLFPNINFSEKFRYKKKRKARSESKQARANKQP
jgi:hypothetical protein